MKADQPVFNSHQKKKKKEMKLSSLLKVELAFGHERHARKGLFLKGMITSPNL